MDLAFSLFIILLAYLLGSIPFGLLLVKMCGLGDIRNIGSGNIGATNVLRTGQRKIAALTLLLDMLKGSVAVVLALAFTPDVQGAAGIAVLLGHIFPVWLKFSGGKGVATFYGVLLAFSPPAALMAGLVWLASAFLLRMSSASALISVCTAPIFLAIFGQKDNLWVLFIAMILILIKHSPNIVRMMHGTEPLIGQLKRHQDEKTDAPTS